MIPGNKDTNRYTKTGLSIAVATLIAMGATTNVLYHEFLSEKEGFVTYAYLDSANIWTICSGLTKIYGRKVTSKDSLSVEECTRLDMIEQEKGLAEMETLVVPEVWNKMSPAAKAGTASFCVHNIGATKCKTSTFLKLLNQDKKNEACAQITNWIRDGGRDCRIRKNGCFGQIDRRLQEDELCLKGWE